MTYETKKEVCDKLQITHERNTQVKRSKIYQFSHEFEIFIIIYEEIILEMYD